MRKTLSVVLATFNEEKNLPSCLDSLKDIADEIVITDGTSSDKTIEIAKEFGAKVIITTNKPNFHINKQMAIDAATKNWILQMDADEHVGQELKEEIKEILEKDPKEFNGYWMPRKNWFLGRFLMKGGQYPDYTLRLYRKGKGRLPQKDVHEQAEVEGKVGYLKSALLHYPYASFKHYVKKWNFYNNFYAVQIKEEQENKNILQKIFYALMYLFIRPVHWLLTTFIRHKGFYDLGQGFVFSLFSALRFPVSYLKYLGIYKVSVLFIILLSIILRFYNFPSRWGLGGDDGRDAIIALEALRRHELPLMGPFSSAGPFVFGGIYYWFIMAAFIILPFFVNAPWIFLSMLGVITVALLIYLGKLVGGKKLSLIIGILAATSPQLVIRSLSLGPHTFVSTFAALLIISYVLLWKTKKQVYAFLAGIFLGLALSFHYQAINLLIFLPAIFFIKSISFKNKITAFVLMIFGFIIPSLPLLYWDLHQSFANINNLLDYFLIGQYRIYVPNSWNIFLFNFIPSYWSFVVGRFYLISFALFVLSAGTIFVLFIRKKLRPELVVMGIIFFILMLVSRFYKGERSEGYLLYLVPFILLFSSFFINYLFDIKNKYFKILAFLFLILILTGNIITLKNSYSNSPVSFFKLTSDTLIRSFPNSKFSLYDYKYKMYNQSMPLSLIMGFDNKIDSKGMPLGVVCYGKDCPLNIRPVLQNGVLLTNLINDETRDRKDNKIWINVNPDSVYDDQVGWLNKYQLKSTFSLEKYIMEKIGKL